MTQPNPAARLIIALGQIVNDDFNERFNQTPEGRRLKELAVRIFKDENPHLNPEDLTMGNPLGDAERLPHIARACRGRGAVSVLFPMQPAWACYVEEARRMIALTSET